MIEFVSTPSYIYFIIAIVAMSLFIIIIPLILSTKNNRVMVVTKDNPPVENCTLCNGDGELFHYGAKPNSPCPCKVRTEFK